MMKTIEDAIRENRKRVDERIRDARAKGIPVVGEQSLSYCLMDGQDPIRRELTWNADRIVYIAHGKAYVQLVDEMQERFPGKTMGQLARVFREKMDEEHKRWRRLDEDIMAERRQDTISHVSGANL